MMRKTPCIDDLYKYYLDNGIITIGDISTLSTEVLMNKILNKVHKHKITKQKDGRWTTYIPDNTKSSGLRLVKRKSKNDLYAFLLDFYHLGKNATLMTFGELFREWIEYKKQFIGAPNSKRGMSPSTIRRYERDYDRYIKGSKLEQTLISEITRPLLETEIVGMIRSNNVIEQSASNLIGYICQAMKFARSSEYIMVNPTDTIDRSLLLSVCPFSPPKDDSDRVLSINEFHSLYKAVLSAQARHPEYIPNYAIELAMLTGMRVGEIAALHWSDVDDAFIHINYSEHRYDYSDRKSELVIGRPKCGKHRVLQLTDEAKAVFEKVKAMGYKNVDDFVFCRKDGTRYTGHDIGCAAERRANDAGVKKTSIHGIRRTVSSMLNTVLPQNAVAAMMGHTERVNERFYNYSVAESAEKKAALETVHAMIINFEDYDLKKAVGNA